MVQVQLPVRWKVKVDGTTVDEAREYFKNHERLKPVRFGFDTDYAEVLEYGCGPLNDFQPTVDGGSYTYDSIYKQIYKWAGKKQGRDGYLPIKNKDERKAFAKKVTDKFFMYGMKAHPYWRPAVNFIEANKQRLFDEGYSLYEICDLALKVALKSIMDNNYYFNGTLIESARIKEVDWREVDGKDLRNYTDDERNIRFKEVGWI